MKAHQRKAQLKRARQHQAYCKARDYRQHVQGWQTDWDEFGAAFRDFENYLERGNTSILNRRIIQLVMFLLGALITHVWMKCS